MQELTAGARQLTTASQAPFFRAGHTESDRTGGTYPLPEAQLEPLPVKPMLDYLSEEERCGIDLTTPRARTGEAVTNAQEILEVPQLVRMCPSPSRWPATPVDLITRTRPTDPSAPDFVKKVRQLRRQRPRRSVHRTGIQGRA